jgi:hypothetical protein
MGYVAAIEWRSVHELRPRVSTSAGQSSTLIVEGAAVAVGAVLGAFIDLAWTAQAEKAVLELHDRQLFSWVRYNFQDIARRNHSIDIRLPVGAQDDDRRQGRWLGGSRGCRLGGPVCPRTLRCFSHFATRDLSLWEGAA